MKPDRSGGRGGAERYQGAALAWVAFTPPARHGRIIGTRSPTRTRSHGLAWAIEEPELRRDRRVAVSVTEAEYQELERRAERAELPIAAVLYRLVAKALRRRT